MSLLSRVRELLSRKKMTIAELERALNFSQGSIGKWDKQSPSSERLQKVADYFQVSTDYLLGRSEQPYYALTEKEKLDIGQEVDRLLDGMATDAEVNFYGEPMTEEGKAALKAAIQMAMELNKQKAKQHFTPKKYRSWFEVTPWQSVMRSTSYIVRMQRTMRVALPRIRRLTYWSCRWTPIPAVWRSETVVLTLSSSMSWLRRIYKSIHSAMSWATAYCISRLALHSCDQSLYRHPSCAWRRRRIALPLSCSIGSMQSCHSCLKRQSPNISACHITL